ncbi:UNKNOWN [Stylonychia lemnae]|uniref:Insulin-like growth factor binding protein, N-terminal n=1 Tax=Stylonychia lemnae TaxID=5949 RepID=A0A078ADA6_STYLE|nr:UNKNOWN [Stylonychia lemnae]|eukprot:CDW80224.1 UNKNOWN [Stylonychia lemnae]
MPSNADFSFFSDGWGTQFSGQYIKKELSPSFIGADSFFVSIFFYSCEKSDFYVYCHQQDSSIVYPWKPIICLSFDSNAHPVITTNLWNDQSNDYYKYTQSFESLTITTGWKWIGINVLNNFDGTTSFTIYESKNSYAAGTYQSQTKILQGVYNDVFTPTTTELIFGCQMPYETYGYYDYCMKGFIYLFQVYSFDHFAAPPVIADLIDCTKASVATCNLCDIGYNNDCLDKLPPQTIEVWNLVNNAGFSSDKLVATVKAGTNDLLKYNDRENYPIMLSGIGVVFGYGYQTFQRKNFLADGYFAFGPMFTIDIWIKMGNASDIPNGLVMPIFGKYSTRTSNIDEFNRRYKVGIAVSNSFLRTYVNQKALDTNFLFVEEYNWINIAVSYQRSNVKQTQLLVFINGKQVANKFVEDAIKYEFNGYITIGDQFNGAIKRISLSNHAYCQSTLSETISLSSLTCLTCDFCDSTDGCYTDCPMLKGYYIDGTNACKKCNELCWTCEDSSSDKCSSCSDKGYKEFGTKCVAQCPDGYQPNEYFRSCEPNNPNFNSDQLSTLNKGIYQVKQNAIREQDIYGCDIGEYYNDTLKQCTSCNMENCDRCDMNVKNKCLICAGYSYLNSFDQCQKCSSSYMKSNNMGKCLDTCGDGRSYSNSLCDDGNIKNDDGCNEKCLIEKDYRCFGGFEGNKDRCDYILTEFLSASQQVLKSIKLDTYLSEGQSSVK